MPSRPSSARVMSERCGWLLASSSLMRPLVDERLHERVVVGDLRQDAVAQLVGPRVADVDHAEPAAGEQEGRERRAHPVERGSPVTMSRRWSLAATARSRRTSSRSLPGTSSSSGRQRGDGHGRGHLAGGVAAHAVGDGEDAGPRVDGVLVALAQQARVGAGGEAQCQGHRRSSSTVLPMRIGCPSGHGRRTDDLGSARGRCRWSSRGPRRARRPRRGRARVLAAGVVVGQHQRRVVGAAERHRAPRRARSWCRRALPRSTTSRRAALRPCLAPGAGRLAGSAARQRPPPDAPRRASRRRQRRRTGRCGRCGSEDDEQPEQREQAVLHRGDDEGAAHQASDR
jgi:hypothetical protein